MKDFNKDVQTARQGEVYFVRVKKLPDGVKNIEPVKGKFTIAHSETGHHHVMEAKENLKYFSSDDPLINYLQVVEATDEVENLLVHLRGHDTHDTVKFSPGVYCAITARESAPEGWRRAAD